MTTSVIFDMDGLMFDTEAIYELAWEYAGQQTGLDINEELRCSIRGNNQAKIRSIFKEKFGEDVDYDHIIALVFEYTAKHIDKYGMPCKPGLYELFDYLKERDYKIAFL